MLCLPLNDIIFIYILNHEGTQDKTIYSVASLRKLRVLFITGFIGPRVVTQG